MEQLIYALVTATGSLSVLAMMAAGIAFMIGIKMWAKRMLYFAIFLMAVAALGPQWIPSISATVGNQ